MWLLWLFILVLTGAKVLGYAHAISWVYVLVPVFFVLSIRIIIALFFIVSVILLLMGIL